MKKILCSVGIHKYTNVEMTDAFTTTYKDRPNWTPIKHMVWYQQCTCCGKRKVKDTVKQDLIYSTRHNGVEYARVAWVEHGRAYLGNEVWKTTDKPKVVTLTVLEGGKK
jgi:hypothetical protein